MLIFWLFNFTILSQLLPLCQHTTELYKGGTPLSPPSPDTDEPTHFSRANQPNWCWLFLSWPCLASWEAWADQAPVGTCHKSNASWSYCTSEKQQCSMYNICLHGIKVEEVSTEVCRLSRCLSQTSIPSSGSSQAEAHTGEKAKVRKVRGITLI